MCHDVNGIFRGVKVCGFRSCERTMKYFLTKVCITVSFLLAFDFLLVQATILGKAGLGRFYGILM